MTFDMITGILAGVVFSCIGVWGLISRSQKKLTFIVSLILGGGVLFVYTIGPLSKSENKLREIIEVNAANVQEIILKPSKRVSNEIQSLVQEDLVITDLRAIEKICNALNTAEVTMNGLKGGNWRVQIDIKTLNRNLKFGVLNRSAKTNLNVSSDGEYGWNYGTLKCDKLGSILEEEINK